MVVFEWQVPVWFLFCSDLKSRWNCYVEYLWAIQSAEKNGRRRKRICSVEPLLLHDWKLQMYNWASAYICCMLLVCRLVLRTIRMQCLLLCATAAVWDWDILSPACSHACHTIFYASSARSECLLIIAFVHIPVVCFSCRFNRLVLARC